jgi:hypothetical protein
MSVKPVHAQKADGVAQDPEDQGTAEELAEEQEEEEDQVEGDAIRSHLRKVFSLEQRKRD